LIPIFNSEPVVNVSCGLYYSVFLTESGSIYITGRQQKNKDFIFNKKYKPVKLIKINNSSYKNLCNNGKSISAIPDK